MDFFPLILYSYSHDIIICTTSLFKHFKIKQMLDNSYLKQPEPIDSEDPQSTLNSTQETDDFLKHECDENLAYRLK